MSSGNAIIARMGLDLSGMRKDLTESEKLMIQSTMRTTKAMTAASRDGSKERHEATHGGKSGNARSLGDLINLATGGSGAVSELSTATHLLGVSAVAAATAIGGAAPIEKIYEVGSAARDLHRELEALTHSQSGPDFSSMDALKKHLEEVRVISEKVKLPGTGGKSE